MATLPVLPVDPQELLWRVSVERYHAMLRAGVLSEDDRVELLEGILVEKMPKNPKHRVATRLVADALRSALPPGWYADEQAPITTLDSEPEPDICIVRGATADYLDRHPSPAEVPLVIEVADSSLARDRGIKQRVYARGGVAAYWILDLKAAALEIYTEPQGDSYRRRLVLSRHDTAPLELGDTVLRFPVSRLLPPG